MSWNWTPSGPRKPREIIRALAPALAFGRRTVHRCDNRLLKDFGFSRRGHTITSEINSHASKTALTTIHISAIIEI
jgi:hypothetical protein